MEQLKPETIIDEKYRVIDTLGVGGMGIVYRVEQLSLNSERALKTIHTEKLSEGVWQRFQREAKAACRLDHSNLVKVFDYGLLEKVTPYYVMEIVQGRTLSARIKILGTLTLEQCLNVFIPTAFALAYAHDKKIIHRDMKPANIMINEDSNGKILDIKILDFGIAKLVSDENLTNALTKPGEVIGSPHFMSPEQSWGGKIDTRSDIYSLGCSMFEALTGLPPFIAKNAVQVIMLHQGTPPPTLAQTAPNLVFNDSIEQVIRVMLAKDPNHRYQSMNELAQDLIAVKGGKQPKFAQAQEKLSGLPTQPMASKSLAVKMPVVENFESDSLSELTTDTGSDDTFNNTFENTGDRTSETLILAPSFLNKLRDSKALLIALSATFLITTITTIVALRPNKAHTASNSTSGSSSKCSAAEAPFAHSKTLENGQKVSVFNFPTEFTCGSIRSLDGHHIIDARREVTIPFGELFFFRPSREFLEHPHLFKKFGSDQIAELDVGDRHMFCDEHMADIKHLSSVRILNLKDVNLSPKCIDDLNGLTHLREITATNSGLDDRSLSQLKRLRHLVFIEAREFASIQTTVKALRGSKKLQHLALGNTCLDDESLKIIASNPNISYLSVPQNPHITDQGLKYLLPLNKLSHLNLVDCQISPESTTTLASFKNLRMVKLNTSHWSRAQVSKLKMLLHKFCKLEEDETEPKKSREVMDQLQEFRTIEPAYEK
ncbi:hypothetical protein BH11CYA1_BH11CYA1_40370 [soil metagenome]